MSSTKKAIVGPFINKTGDDFIQFTNSGGSSIFCVNSEGYISSPSILTQRCVVTLDSTDLYSLDTQPIILIPAPGEGFVLDVRGIFTQYKFQTTPYQSNTLIFITFPNYQSQNPFMVYTFGAFSNSIVPLVDVAFPGLGLDQSNDVVTPGGLEMGTTNAAFLAATVDLVGGYVNPGPQPGPVNRSDAENQPLVIEAASPSVTDGDGLLIVTIDYATIALY